MLTQIYRGFFHDVTKSALASSGATAKLTKAADSATTTADDPSVRWRERISYLCELSDEELAKVDIAVLNLVCAQLLPEAEGVDFTACLRRLDDWARLVRLNTEHWWPNFDASAEKFNFSHNRFRMAALVTVLQRQMKVHYNLAFSEGDYNATDSRNLFIHGLLNGHGGTCVTMPVLYIAVGRRLGYPLKLVEAYQHLFARWDEPCAECFDIECTCRGFAAFDDDHFAQQPKPIPAELLNRGIYLRSLAPREELAHFLIERGHCLTDNLRLREAEAAFRYATQLAPERLRISSAWPVASLLRIAIEDAFERAHRDGGHAVDLRTVRLPDHEQWQCGVAVRARECLQRIVRIHSRKRAAATNRYFEQLAGDT
jgi:hypothetical protein